MKPLSQGFKQKAYHWLVFGRFRKVAKPVYQFVLTTTLAWHRFVDLFYPRDKGNVSDLTLIIKTFERPYAVKRLLASIRRRYPVINIIVVDDSRQSIELAGVKMLKLPYDTGISAGRNAALDICQTRFFLLLDDDFVFSHHQRLSRLCAYMKAHRQVDILGGRCIDLPLHIKHEYHYQEIAADRAAKRPFGSEIGGFKVVDRLQNYFIGRTKTIRAVKWNPTLKVMEHTDFFSRAKGILITVYDPEMLVLHAKWPFDMAYNRMRFRAR